MLAVIRSRPAWREALQSDLEVTGAAGDRRGSGSPHPSRSSGCAYPATTTTSRSTSPGHAKLAVEVDHPAWHAGAARLACRQGSRSQADHDRLDHRTHHRHRRRRRSSRCGRRRRRDPRPAHRAAPEPTARPIGRDITPPVARIAPNGVVGRDYHATGGTVSRPTGVSRATSAAAERVRGVRRVVTATAALVASISQAG